MELQVTALYAAWPSEKFARDTTEISHIREMLRLVLSFLAGVGVVEQHNADAHFHTEMNQDQDRVVSYCVTTGRTECVAIEMNRGWSDLGRMRRDAPSVAAESEHSEGPRK